MRLTTEIAPFLETCLYLKSNLHWVTGYSPHQYLDPFKILGLRSFVHLDCIIFGSQYRYKYRQLLCEKQC